MHRSKIHCILDALLIPALSTRLPIPPLEQPLETLDHQLDQSLSITALLHHQPPLIPHVPYVRHHPPTHQHFHSLGDHRDLPFNLDIPIDSIFALCLKSGPLVQVGYVFYPLEVL